MLARPIMRPSRGVSRAFSAESMSPFPMTGILRVFFAR